MEPACQVNEKGTREKNDGNEDVSMDDNEKIEVDSDEGFFPEAPKWTRKGDRKRTYMRYNRVW